MTVTADGGHWVPELLPKFEYSVLRDSGAFHNGNGPCKNEEVSADASGHMVVAIEGRIARGHMVVDVDYTVAAVQWRRSGVDRTTARRRDVENVNGLGHAASKIEFPRRERGVGCPGREHSQLKLLQACEIPSVGLFSHRRRWHLSGREPGLWSDKYERVREGPDHREVPQGGFNGRERDGEGVSERDSTRPGWALLLCWLRIAGSAFCSSSDGGC
ncbi:hypothetical protein B0H11DRAFT_1914927 [Mycena galericulata]|nr:hypothetical protein B0H11DRAFT_1914927 [Mycena galericulata]